MIKSFFWSLVIILITIGFFAAIANIADAALPRFLRNTGPHGATKVGVLATIANGLGKLWGAIAMFGGIILVAIQLQEGWSGLGVFTCAIFLTSGADVFRGAHGFRRLIRVFAKSRGIAAAILGSILVIGALIYALVFNPSAGWYPVRVRTLNIQAADGKTAEDGKTAKEVNVVPTPSGGFFKAADVFGEVFLKDFKTMIGSKKDIVLIDPGLGLHVPGYDIKYEEVPNMPFVTASIKESWKGSVQDSYARKGVKEYRSVTELAGEIALVPTIESQTSSSPISPSPKRLTPISNEAPKGMSVIWAILATIPFLGVLLWWAIKRPVAGERGAWGVLPALAAVFALFFLVQYFTT